jgi:hypothetical protein
LTASSSGSASSRSCRPASVSATLRRSRSSRRAELTLQRLDLSAQPRLGEMQRLGGPTEMQVLGERHERSELSQIKLPDHQHSLSRRKLDPGQR